VGRGGKERGGEGRGGARACPLHIISDYATVDGGEERVCNSTLRRRPNATAAESPQSRQPHRRRQRAKSVGAKVEKR